MRRMRQTCHRDPVRPSWPTYSGGMSQQSRHLSSRTVILSIMFGYVASTNFLFSLIRKA
jgi:hypothetical protein